MADVGWMVPPFSPSFWLRAAVRELNPHLAFYGPLPQTRWQLSLIDQTALLPAYVYAIQDFEGEVLYVGKTVNPAGRLGSHRARKPWWPSVGILTLLGVEADDRGSADARAFRLEREAIQDLGPLNNIVGVA